MSGILSGRCGHARTTVNGMRLANYYLVVDLEATCDDLGSVPRHESEIIEIGCVLVDGETLAPIAEETMFVRPQLHPITPFCTRLTTITPAMVATAPAFPVAYRRLVELGEGALFCSWGNYDRNQLAADAARHGLAPPFADHWNLKEAFTRATNGARGSGMTAALRRLGLAPQGTHHRGIDDARNIARMLPFLVRGTATGPARPPGPSRTSRA
jgi:inhibitor of KinA sporulation pathway (predicted exonuclease)